MRLAGVDSGKRDLLAKLCDQRAETLAAGDGGIALLRTALSITEMSFQILAVALARARIAVPPNRRRSFGSTEAHDTSALRAMHRRWRGWARHQGR